MRPALHDQRREQREHVDQRDAEQPMGGRFLDFVALAENGNPLQTANQAPMPAAQAR